MRRLGAAAACLALLGAGAAGDEAAAPKAASAADETAAAPAADAADGKGAPERVVAALSQNRISITAGFEGSEIFVYGAIARERPITEAEGPLGVVVRIEGPSEPVVVRRKDRVFGVWANAASAEIDAAPSFYAVASTGPLHETISWTEDLRLGVSLDNALRFVDAGEAADDRDAFLDALVRLRRASGRYVLAPGGVSLSEDVLFQTSVSLPADIHEGVYSARVFLTRERMVIDSFETEIRVNKAGLERLLYDLAKEQPALYGVLSILVALAAGLGASEVFRYLRR